MYVFHIIPLTLDEIQERTGKFGES